VKPIDLKVKGLLTTLTKEGWVVSGDGWTAFLYTMFENMAGPVELEQTHDENENLVELRIRTVNDDGDA
jgi:hypothetical protein